MGLRQWMSSTGNQIPVAVILALLIGFMINKFITDMPKEVGKLVGLPGDLWIRALKAIVIPLILTSMITAMQRLKKIPSGGSKIAKYALWYYFITTLIALGISVVFSLLIIIPYMKPISPEELLLQFPDFAQEKEVVSEGILARTLGIILGILPENIVKAMADSDLIAVITTGTVIGVIIQDTEENPSTFMRFVLEVESIVTHIVIFLVKLSPIGIFCLILPPLIATSVEKMITFVGLYLAAIFSAMLFHLFVIYPVIYFIFMRKNPFAYLSLFTSSALTALGTASSAASIPVTMECAHKAGIRPDIYKLLVPLGVSLNMDGTAINLPMAVIFMAAGMGKTLGVVDYLVLMFTGFLATIGAAPIPAASVVFYMMLMSAVGLKASPIFNLLLAIDWLTERPATVLNVMGDTIALAICQKYGLGIDVDPSVNAACDMEEADKKM